MMSFFECKLSVKNSIMMTLITFIISISSANADDFTQCSESFYDGNYPEFTNPKLSKDTQLLCFDGFAVIYSGVSRTPLWSAEYLDRKRLQQAKEIDREDSFHEESKLPKSMGANLSDYSGSGYDRGQLAPNGNMGNRSQQYDSFSLANITLHSPRNNHYIWRNIESATRYLTQKHGEVYTITGVAFTDKKVKQLAGRVLVPSQFFKAVYIPALNQAGVYYAPNDESEHIEVISVDELTGQIGIDVFPILERSVKAEVLELPLKAGKGLDTIASSNEKPAWILFLWSIIDWLVAQFQT